MRLKQRWLTLFVVFLFFTSLPVRLLADGTYYVGRDNEGVYFQTDQDGGWYIDISDLRYFKIGQTGTYSIKRDKNGTYLITDKKRQFYLLWSTYYTPVFYTSFINLPPKEPGLFIGN